jgi:hypothetical protein
MILRAAFAIAIVSFDAGAQQTVPVRTVAPPSAITTEKLGTIFGVKELPGGRVLVDDAGSLRLLLFAADLSTFTVVSDTSAASKNKYGDSPAPIIAYIGDSTLFMPFLARGFLLVDPNGQITRAAAPPKSSDLRLIRGSRSLVDPRGRLVYRAAFAQSTERPLGPVAVTQAPDSAPLVRADFDTRTVDTIAYIRIPKQQRTERTMAAPGTGAPPSTKVLIAPLSTVDDWTMTADGTIAIVRGQDYHIDWISANGTVASAPKMPFDWRRVTDEEKQRLSDSTVKFWRERLDEAKARDAARPPRPPPPGGTGVSFSMLMTINEAEGSTTSMSTNAIVETFPLNDWPSYFTPVRGGTTMADFEGNVWILPATSSRSKGGGIVYDVVNRKDGLFERVELPPDRSISGFGPGGTLYLMWRDSSSVWHLEKTRIIRS